LGRITILLTHIRHTSVSQAPRSSTGIQRSYSQAMSLCLLKPLQATPTPHNIATMLINSRSCSCHARSNFDTAWVLHLLCHIPTLALVVQVPSSLQPSTPFRAQVSESSCTQSLVAEAAAFLICDGPSAHPISDETVCSSCLGRGVLAAVALSVALWCIKTQARTGLWGRAATNNNMISVITCGFWGAYLCM
jgi:hypothetical protein